MLEKFVETLSNVDNADNKARLMLEDAAEADMKENDGNSAVMELFGSDEIKSDTPEISDRNFERTLITVDVPENLPEYKGDYIQASLDRSIGIESPYKEYGAEIPNNMAEAAGDVTVTPKKVLTMKPSDAKELMRIISVYNEDITNKTKNRATLKRFIANILRAVSSNTEVSTSVNSAIDILYEKFAQNRTSNIPTTEADTPDAKKKELIAKLNAINSSI